MKLTRQRRTFTIGSIEFDAARTADGVAELWADDDDALACALGAAHAGDRLVQMVMARIVGQGRISECLADDDTTFGIDVFMRQMGFRREAEREVAELDAGGASFRRSLRSRGQPRPRRPAAAAGVSSSSDTGPNRWSPADTLLTIKLMSYLGLAQSQQDVEKLIIQAIHGGAAVEALQAALQPAPRRSRRRDRRRHPRSRPHRAPAAARRSDSFRAHPRSRRATTGR